MEQWTNKVAVVTGASSGIGEAITRALVSHGIHVVALARRQDKLRELADGLQASRGTVHPLGCDVRREENILKAFHYAESKFGGIDILVNNAGVSSFESITDGNTETFRRILEVNVLAPAIATREAVRLMRKRGGGHIININSTLGRNPLLVSQLPMNLYPASKFALDAMTANVRQEVRLNKDRIRVTGIHPGLVRTEIVAASGVDPDMVYRLPHVQPSDVADTVVFALSQPDNVQIDDLTVTAAFRGKSAYHIRAKY